MEFLPLDIEKHDLFEIARLIYVTSEELSCHVFGKKGQKAYGRIKRMMEMGDNSFGKERVYVVLDNGKLAGVLLAYSGAEKAKRDGPVFIKTMGVRQSLKFMFIVVPTLKKLITMEPAPDDFYISNICVTEDRRSKGVGTFIMENARRLASQKGCKRIILDVDVKNEAGIRFYERESFEKLAERRAKIGGQEEATFQMGCLI